MNEPDFVFRLLYKDTYQGFLAAVVSWGENELMKIQQDDV